MSAMTRDQRRLLEGLHRPALELLQWTKLNSLLMRILPANVFYRDKLAHVPLPVDSWEAFHQWPLTTKRELEAGGEEGYARNRTYGVDHYVRFHRTSGTHGRPMIVLDTAEDWRWWLETWQFTLDAAELTPADRVLMAFSFGPFIGFWSAHDAVIARGALAIPGGGLSSLARLDVIRAQGVSVVCCTPSYALYLAELGAQHGIQVATLGVRVLIVAGEPGGSVPTTCARLEQLWGARVIDHAGASEVGPWGFSDSAGRGLRIVESEFLAEFLSVETGLPARPGELSELILTTLGRIGSPVIRYRTGDLVRPRWVTGEANQFVLLEGGVLGRADDMLIIRGVNVFPSAVEAILRGFPEVAEYRLTATRTGELDELLVEVEDARGQPERIAQELQTILGLRIEVREVPSGTLPRFEGKGRRFVDQRSSS